MIKELLYKWFGLEPMPCLVCDVLREQLARSEQERRELLQRALAPPNVPIEEIPKEKYEPVTPPFIPWRLRQQMLEAEDRKAYALKKNREKEIAELEKELGVGVSADSVTESKEA